MPVDATKREVEKVMSRLSRPIYLERQNEDEELFSGGCLLGIHLERFISLETGEKLLLIRSWLKEMYGDEYSRKNVAQRTRLSIQGLVNVEERNRNSHYHSTISDLIEEYKVSKEVILNEFKEGELPVGIYIGKPQDMKAYFFYYFSEHGSNHVLDQTDYSKFDWGDHTGEQQEVSVEFFMKVKHVDTGEPINTKNIAQVILSSDSLNRISEIIIKDIDLVAHKHSELMEQRRYITELEQRLSYRESSSPNPNINKESIQGLKDLIKTRQEPRK